MKRSYIVHPGGMILPSIDDKLGKNWRNEYLFLQDYDPTHNATKIYKYLSKTGVRLMAFSPNSPEFNIIEPCWNILQRRVNDLIFH